jgi:hypothetical protein
MVQNQSKRNFRANFRAKWNVLFYSIYIPESKLIRSSKSEMLTLLSWTEWSPGDEFLSGWKASRWWATWAKWSSGYELFEWSNDLLVVSYLGCMISLWWATWVAEWFGYWATWAAESSAGLVHRHRQVPAQGIWSAVSPAPTRQHLKGIVQRILRGVNKKLK